MLDRAHPVATRRCHPGRKKKEKDAARSVIVFDSPTVDVENEHSTLIKAEPPDSPPFPRNQLRSSLGLDIFPLGNPPLPRNLEPQVFQVS